VVVEQPLGAAACDGDLDRARLGPELDLQTVPVTVSHGGRADLGQHELRLLDLVVSGVGEDAAERCAADRQERGVGRQRQADVRIGSHR
jgi:hypothetical protein